MLKLGLIFNVGLLDLALFSGVTCAAEIYELPRPESSSAFPVNPVAGLEFFQNIADSDEPFPCGRFRGVRFSCIQGKSNTPSGRDVKAIVPPYPLPIPTIDYSRGYIYESRRPGETTEFAIERDDNLRLPGAIYAWVRLENVIQGEEILAAWARLADEGKAFDCRNDWCSVLVHARSKMVNGDLSTGLSVCSIHVGKKVSGAPGPCKYIAITTANGVIVKAAYAFAWEGYAMAGRTDFIVKMANLPVNGEEPSLYPALSKAIESSLTSGGFQLEVSEDGDNLLGTSDFRFSKILKRWIRETVRVSVVVDFSGSRETFHKDPRSRSVSIATTLYVSEQNSPEARDWHLPSEQQSAAYLGPLYASFKAQLLKLCTKPKWKRLEGMWSTMTCEE